MGRPATGRTTKAVGVRLPLESVKKLEKRAANLGLAPSAWVALVLERELKTRPGPHTRGKAKLGK